MNRFLVPVAWLGALSSLAAQGSTGRWLLEARSGVILNTEDSPGAFLRKNGQPGNPLVLVKRQGVLSLRGAYAAKPWLEFSLDGSLGNFECASDRMDGTPVSAFGAGKLRLIRTGCWFSLTEGDRPFHAPTNPTRARFSAGLLLGQVNISGLHPLQPGAQNLGLETLQPRARIIVSLEARGELKLTAGWILSLEVTTFRGVSGPVVTAGTAAGSPYQGTGIKLAPSQILLGLEHPF